MSVSRSRDGKVYVWWQGGRIPHPRAIGNGSTTTFRRNKAKGAHRLERDSELQRRVQERRFFEYAKGWWQQYLSPYP
jgi:hypothetical protein